MNKKELIDSWKQNWIQEDSIEKIILKITGLSKSQLFLSDEIGDEYKQKIEAFLNRLKDWEPIEYIIQNAEFYWLDFYIDNRVLIPRNDTEVMIDEVLNEISNELNQEQKEIGISLIDVWTGSSCIPISIIENSQHIQKAYVIDISKDALDVSQKNIHNHWFWNKISQIQWDLLNNFLWNKSDFELSHNTIITANLPYIKDNDFDNIDKEVVKNEPSLALYWWEKTGFELYEKLIHECIQLKQIYHFRKLVLFIEIGFDQYEYSKQYIEVLGFTPKYYKDNWEILRCVKVEI